VGLFEVLSHGGLELAQDRQGALAFDDVEPMAGCCRAEDFGSALDQNDLKLALDRFHLALGAVEINCSVFFEHFVFADFRRAVRTVIVFGPTNNFQRENTVVAKQFAIFKQVFHRTL
jgi:hypothetical protein